MLGLLDRIFAPEPVVFFPIEEHRARMAQLDDRARRMEALVREAEQWPTPLEVFHALMEGRPIAWTKPVVPVDIYAYGRPEEIAAAHPAVAISHALRRQIAAMPHRTVEEEEREFLKEMGR